MAAQGADSTVQDLNKLYSQAKGLQSRFEPIWYLNCAFVSGDQWLFWNRGRLDRPRLDPWRVTLVDNRIIGIVQSEIARMTKNRPVWQDLPLTGSDDDQQAALLGERVLDYLWGSLYMRRKLEDVLRWSRVTGAGFWKVFWDSQMGDQVKVLVDGNGNPICDDYGAPVKSESPQADMYRQLASSQPEVQVNERQVCQGDVNIEVCPPFNFFPDPLATSLDEAEWVIEEKVKSPEYVKARYGVELEGDTDVAAGPAESRLFPSFQLGGTSSYRGIKVREYWAKPSSQHANGRRCVWAKNRVLFEGDNSYKAIPYVMFSGIKVPGRFWPSSVTEQLRGPQTELNKIKSQITENANRIGNPALMASRQANVQYSGVPGERIDFDDTVPNAIPSYLQPPEMPQYVREQQDRIEKSMQEISGQHEVTSAGVPPGVTAASAINLLQEADDTRLGPAITDMENSIGQAGTMLLKLVAEYYTDERTIMISGEDQQLDVLDFRGAMLRGNTRVEVQAGSAFPRSKAAKQAAIQDTLSLALQYSQQPLNPRDLRKVLKDYEAGGLEKLFGDLSRDEEQIHRENRRMGLTGTPVDINSYDNDEYHVDGHTDFQKTAGYERLSPQARQAVELHVEAHRERLVQSQLPMQQMQLPMPEQGQQNGQQQPQKAAQGGQ